MSKVHELLQQAARQAVAEGWDASKFQDESYAYFEIATVRPKRGWYANSTWRPRNAGPFKTQMAARDDFRMTDGTLAEGFTCWFEG